MEVNEHCINTTVMYCKIHTYSGQLYFVDHALPHLFRINAPICIAGKCWVRLMEYCIGHCPMTITSKQWMQMAKYIRLLFFMNCFFSALKRQNDKHSRAHPPLSTTVPLCGSYGKSNFTHHGLCRLLSISSTQFLWRHCDFINQ